MTDATVTNAMCEALPPVRSAPFDFSVYPLDNTHVPFHRPVDIVLDQFPAAVILMGVGLALIIILRPRPDRIGLKVVLIPLWFVFSTLVLALAGSYWWVPKATEYLWRHQKTALVEPSLSTAKDLTTGISNVINLKPVKRWSAFIEQLYDHHTSRLLLRHKQFMPRDETLQLIDKLLYTAHIQSRIAVKGYRQDSQEYFQVFVLTSVLRNLAHQYFAEGDFQTALRIATQGYHIARTTRYEQEVVLPIKGQLIREEVVAKNYINAANMALDIPPGWDEPGFRQLIEAIQYGLMKANLSNGIATNWHNLIAQSQQLQRHYRNTSQATQPSPHITCNMAFLHGLRAIRELDNNEPKVALNNLETAQMYVADSTYVRELMPITHYRIGANFMEQDHYLSAALAFGKANDLEPRRDYACDAATAWRLAAYRSIATDNLGSATASADKAKKLCARSKADNDLSEEISFHQAQEHMKYGRWEKARLSFKQLIHMPRTANLARYYLSDLEQARARHLKLSGSRHILSVPEVTGQLCTHFVEANGNISCKAVVLFNERREIGRSMNNKLTDVIFNFNDGYLAVYDNQGNSQYDTWEVQKNNSIHQWIDMDADYRPDYEQTFAEDRLVSRRQLSGRISMRFVGGLVNKKYVDIFSRPDTFLVAEKNGSYFGRTETVDNNTRPSWRNYFVFHYKFGDVIDVYAFDEDLFSNEFIDHVRFDTLPQSGYINMNRGHVTLAAKVEESTLPEGRYQGKKGQSIFTDPAFLIEQTPLAELVRTTYEEDGRAQIAATIASIAIPEAAIFTLMNRARFAEKLVVAWLGFDATYQALNRSADDVQH